MRSKKYHKKLDNQGISDTLGYKERVMNCFQIEVRGATFTIWAPTIQDALETFMIDMEFYEVPKDVNIVAE